jgi:drug/metabolite transporter (DMT)-like permease
MVIPFSIFLHKERVSARAILGAIVACAGLALLLCFGGT